MWNKLVAWFRSLFGKPRPVASRMDYDLPAVPLFVCKRRHKFYQLWCQGCGWRRSRWARGV